MPERPRPSVFTEEEWKSILAYRNRPPEERFRDMVERGVIDEQGNVLIRMPSFGDEDDEEEQDGKDR